MLKKGEPAVAATSRSSYRATCLRSALPDFTLSCTVIWPEAHLLFQAPVLKDSRRADLGFCFAPGLAEERRLG
jgi:hypothetical protein